MKIHSILHSQAKTFLKKKNNGHTCKLNPTMSQTLSTDERHSQAKTFLKKKNNGHTCKLNPTMSQTLSTDERHSQAKTFLKKKNNGHTCKLNPTMSQTLSTKLFLMAQLSKTACQQQQQNTNRQRCRLTKAAQLISPEKAVFSKSQHDSILTALECQVILHQVLTQDLGERL